MIIERNETVILELSRFSTPSNFEWRSVDPPVAIPVTEPTTVQVFFLIVEIRTYILGELTYHMKLELPIVGFLRVLWIR